MAIAKGKKQSTPRLSPEEREEQIVQKAIRYFATNGFTAGTRDLVKEIGVTQPLLYRYFPNKEALVNRVFEEVYLSRWNPNWDDMLQDRGIPLRDRMYLFYKSYSKAILKREWIRIFVLAGLTREGINQKYLDRLREKVFDQVLSALRHEYRLPAPDSQQYEDEIEMIWGLHASIFYLGMRKWVYGMSIPKDMDRTIEQKVDMFLDGAQATMRRIRQL